MSTARTGRPFEPHWHNLYKAAILEIDTAKLRGRVEEAKQAIHARMEELALSDQNGEWETLSDALNVLEDLLKMNQLFHREPHNGED
jgi:hypothetical protein